eukprot:s5222_g1.t1
MIVSHKTHGSNVAPFQDWQRALHLFSTLAAWRVEANLITFSAAVSACEEGRAWREALDLLRQMTEGAVQRDDEDVAVKADVISYNASISACEKGNQWHRAVDLLLQLRQRRLEEDPRFEALGIWLMLLVPQDMISSLVWFWGCVRYCGYSSAILACDQAGEWQQALLLLTDIQQRRLQVNVITYSSAIHACETRGKWRQALSLLEDLLGCCSALQWASGEKGTRGQRGQNEGFMNAATGKIARGVLLQNLRKQETLTSSPPRPISLSRSLALGLRLARGLVRDGALVPLTFTLAPGLSELLWRGQYGDDTEAKDMPNGGQRESAHPAPGAAPGPPRPVPLVPLGVAERLSSWMTSYRSISSYLTAVDLELLPYLCPLEHLEGLGDHWEITGNME